jgi:subtilase family serine protease
MRYFYLATAACVGMLPILASAQAADVGARVEKVANGLIITPSSSLAREGAHTNVKIFVPNGVHTDASAPSGKYETPASLACLYGVTKKVKGCNPTSLKTVATGGSKIVAIVDAYDDPNATADLTVFSKQFGLPAITSSNFAVVYGSGSKPAQDSSGGWELEESLDVDMAHALAPNAKVILVEAASNSLKDLEAAETAAIKLVEAAGGGEVTNSWAGGEDAKEAKLEKIFAGTNTVIFASAGDSPGVGIPSALADVVSVGGTSINRNTAGDFENQTTWSSTGGGLSAYIPIPSFQSGVAGIVGTQRGTPDISAVANPNTGVWVYDTVPYGGQVLDWAVLGGTSVSSPLTAALVNNAASFNASGTAELTEIYANLGNKKAFTDVTKGACGNSKSGTASKGYDLCTGVGTPLGTTGK